MESTASEEKAESRPSGMKGIAEGIRTLVAESTASPAAAKEAVVESEEKPCVECEEKEAEAAKAAKKSRLFIVDKETGQEIPAVFTSEGKDYEADSVDKLKTWTGLGIHANRRLEELKKFEEPVKMVLRAIEEGRIVIKDKVDSSPPVTEKVEEAASEDEEDLITDPAVLKERQKRQALEGEVKELKKTIDSLKVFVVSSKTDEMKKQIESEIEQLSKTYPLGKKRSKEVWKLLAEIGEDGAPAYTVETAMKTVHEQNLSDFQEWTKDHPEFIEKDKIKKEGIQEYLKDKEEKEKAPVSAPSATGTGAVVEAKPEIKGMKDAVSKMKDFLKQSTKAGKSL